MCTSTATVKRESWQHDRTGNFHLWLPLKEVAAGLLVDQLLVCHVCLVKVPSSPKEFQGLPYAHIWSRNIGDGEIHHLCFLSCHTHPVVHFFFFTLTYFDYN